MIRFTLRCTNGHEFDSWFASNAAYDRLAAAGHLSCSRCGISAVTKALMAPAVQSAPDAPAAPPADPEAALAARIEALRREVEANSEYVGERFATEARAIHAGEAPERAIWGEARLDEARALHEDGVPIAPLPFIARRNTN